MAVARWVPGLATIRNYKAAYLPRDLAAGLTLGAVLVPVGLAYGELAGLPLAGLYGSMLPLLAYALFGSSRLLVVGPDSAMAAIVAVAVLPLAAGDPVRLALLCAVLGVMVGVICIAGGLLRLGFIANFLSKPVIVGFMHGIALVIVGSQLPKVLGIKGDGETTLEQFESLLPRLGETNLVALGAALLAFSDTMVTARAFAARSGDRIDASQELLGIGVANLMSGISHGLPISASDSRTAVAEAAGSRSQVTSIVAAAVVAAVMLWLAEYLYYLPAAALGGILIAAAWSLCDFSEFARLWRFRGISLAGALVTLAGVVVLGVMEGILLGVVFSIVLLLRALAVPPDAALGCTPEGEWHDPAHRPAARPVPGILVYRFAAPLFFANCGRFRERIEALLAVGPSPVTAVVIDGSALQDVDIMGCDTLLELEGELGARGIRLVFGSLSDGVRRDVERGLAIEGEAYCFPSVTAAVAAVQAS